MADIESLNIKIKANASSAAKSIDSLTKKLALMDGALSSINTGKLTALSNGLSALAKSANEMRKIDSRTFTTIANNIQKFANMKSSGINKTASSLNTLSESLSRYQSTSVNLNVSQVTSLANSIAKLGGQRIEKAIEAMPRLANALEELLQKLSRAPAIRSNIVSIVQSLGQISKRNRNVVQTTTETTSAWNKFTGVLGRVKASTSGIASRLSLLSGAMQKTKEDSKSLAYYFGKLYASYFLVIRGIKALGKAIVGSMDYVESYNYWSVALGKISKDWSGQFQQFGYDSAETYAKSFSDRLKQLNLKMTGYDIGDNGELTSTGNIGLGLDPNQLIQFQAQIMSVTNSMGLFGETSINTSKALSMLSADLSSLTNTDLTDTMQHLQSALIGQSRAVYRYGIDITNATLQEYALANGIDKKVSAMTQGEKAQLRLLAILDQSRVAWADQANTIGSVANQYRIFKQQISNLGRILGNLFLPIVQRVLPVVNGLVIALQRLFSALGFKIFGADWQKNIMDGISGGGADLEDMADAGDDLSDALDDSGDSAKDLKKTLSTLPFDELNKLSDNSKDNSSSSSNQNNNSGQIDLSGAISDALAEYESVWDDALKKSSNAAEDFADAITKAFKKVWDIAEPTRKAISNLYENGFKKLESFTWKSLESFWVNFLQPIGRWMLSDNSGLPKFFNITNLLLNGIDWNKLNTSLDKFFESLQKPTKFVWNNLMGFYEHFLVPIAKWSIGEGLPQLLDILTKFNNSVNWDGLTDALNKLWDALAPFAKNVGQGIIKFFSDLFGFGAEFINGTVIDGISGLANAINKIKPETAERIGYAIGVIATSLVALNAVGAVTTVVGNIVKILQPFATVASIAATAVEALVTAFGLWVVPITLAAVALLDLWHNSELFRESVKDMAAKIKKSLIDAFEELGDSITDLFGSFGRLYDKMRPIVELFGILSTTLAGHGISTAIDLISNKLSGLVDVMSAGMDIISGFIDLIAGFVTLDYDRAIDGLVGINDASDKMSESLPKAFSGIGTNVAQGFLDGIDDVMKNIDTWVAKHITIPFIKNFCDLFGIHSPSTVMKEKGGFIIDGMYDGMDSKMSTVTGFADTLKRNFVGKFDNASTWLPNSARQMIVGLRDGWNGNLSLITDVVDDLPQKLANSIGDLRSKGKEIMQSFANGLSSVSIKLPHFDIGWSNVSFLGGSFSIPSFNGISWYAKGGFPGEIWGMNEYGNPEMVGKLGGSSNKTAVANNAIITEAIQGAVTEAIVDVLPQILSQYTDRGGDLYVEVKTQDDEVLAAAVERGYRKRSSRMNPTPIF